MRLIPPQYVKPFVRRGKNNRNDAEAIGEAASRPTLRFVPVKSAETQAEAMDLSARDLLVRQRTQLVNAVRGHAAEFGVIAAKGIAQVDPLLRKIAETDMPQAAKATLAQLGRVIAQLDVQLAEINQRLAVQHKTNPVSQRLAAVPGVGPLTALTVAMKVDAGQFEPARHFAAWLGLTPKERSTGSRPSLEASAEPAMRGCANCWSWCYGGDPSCQARKQDRQPMAAAIAGAPAAQSGGGCSGQQDGPHSVGHDGERHGLPAHAASRLTVRHRRGAKRQP